MYLQSYIIGHICHISLCRLSVSFQVIKVGVTCIRYVCLEHARPWVIHAYRNIKGRGLHVEEEESDAPPLVTSLDKPVLPGTLSDQDQKEPQNVQHEEEISEPVVKKPRKDANDATLKETPTAGENPETQSEEPEAKKIKLDPLTSGNTDTLQVEDVAEVDEGKGEVSNEKKEANVELTEDSENVDNSKGKMVQNADDAQGKVADTVKDKTEENVGETSEGTAGGIRVSKRVKKRKLEEVKESKPDTFAVSTYDKVRLVIQPWRKPEGGINKPIIKMMLESVMLFLMMNPGSSEKCVLQRYSPYLQPVVLENIVQILEDIGCVTRSYLSTGKVSLFSKPSVPEIYDHPAEGRAAVYLPTEECLFRLGQFGKQFFPDVKWPSTTTLFGK